MSKERKSLTLDPDLVKEIDKNRGFETLSSYVNRTLRGVIFSKEKEE